MIERKLIINADDFGISNATNQAIKELLEDKKITSTSLIANANYAEEAIEIARELKQYVGVHLTLNSDFAQHPWRVLSEISDNSLTDDNGNLYSDVNLVAKAKAIDVFNECEAQIRYLLDKGILIDHIDNHSGTMYGINKRLFFLIAFRLARKYDLPFRFPKYNYFLEDYFTEKTPLLIKIAHKVITYIAKYKKVRLIDDMITNPYSNIQDYNTLKDYYLNAITNMRCNITELFMHPSYPCPIHSPLTSEWQKRVWELEFLNSSAFSNRLSDEGIKLLTYRDI